MSQDVVSDGLNEMMNAKKASKNNITLRKFSKVLLDILAIGKIRGYIQDYKIDGKKLHVEFGKLNYCKSIKPRYVVKVRTIDKYVRRYLPARGMGILIVSTSQGLMTHYTALEKNLGGSVIAYFY